MNSVELRDPKLLGHGARTAWYALQLAIALRLPDQELDLLRYAAYLHDVGKLSLPPEILIKEEPLNSQEYHLLQSHPRAAMALLDPWPFLKIPSIWIAHHHERWDGSGYPNGLKSFSIPLGSRIIAIADMYDVLTIRTSTDPESDLCLSTLRWYSGSHFDPELLDTFSKLVPAWAGSKGKKFEENSLYFPNVSMDRGHQPESVKEGSDNVLPVGDLANSLSVNP